MTILKKGMGPIKKSFWEQNWNRCTFDGAHKFCFTNRILFDTHFCTQFYKSVYQTNS